MNITTVAVHNFSSEEETPIECFREFYIREFDKKSHSKHHVKVGENYG
ncbi:MAG: hypothetical protein GPJ54_04225 [Candidatus Heimdallarchaeota archaeon]|nr:hypothetical protein [Candidatus Heimdallarchaeota archaeon]